MADFIQGDYQYTIIDDEVWVQVVDTTKSSYEPLNSTVVYNNVTYTVTSMENCFLDCISFNQPITIPNSVTSMKGCFRNCADFNQSITIPNSVTSMEDCFWNCTSFNQSITIPNSVINMNHCFALCANFNQPIIISNSVINMNHCFMGCTNFNQPITIPNSVTNMEYCFFGCISFNQPITIPNLVTDLIGCFYGCTNFNQSITIPNSVTNMESCFLDCISFNQPITIPNSVTSMEDCFWNCTSFNQPITIPNSVTNMKGCFRNCTNFNQPTTIPNSVINMNYCFRGCTSLNQLIEIMSDNITNMSYCFYGCEKLDQSIIIPEGVENIDSCFEGCLMYQQPVLIPSTVTTMINSFKDTLVSFVAFANIINDRTKTENCFQVLGDHINIVFINDVSYSAWQRNYNFGTSVIEMSSGALRDAFIQIGDYYYNNPFNLDVYAQRRETTKKVYGPIISKFNFSQRTYYTTDLYYAFRECENLIKAPIIPNTVTHMTGCFDNCTSFNKAITIPNSVEDMSNCFRGCTSFNQPITIPNSVTNMYSCFYDCISFNQPITIPNSVEDMSNCFKNCIALSNNITVRGYRSNNGGLFTGTNKSIYICFGSGSESAANAWRQVAAQYPNVHFEADDHPAPNLTLTATRGTGTGENWVPSADGDSIKLEATWSINTEFLPYGYEVTRNNPEVFLDNNSSSDEFITNIIYKTLSTEPLNQHTFTAQLSDGYKTTTVAAIVTRVGALLDFLGNQNPKSPYVDKPGTGMAIGTLAIRSGLDIEFPTTIGNGLIPPTQPVNPEICESQDSIIDLDKNYYVLGGNKYYKVNITKGIIEGTSTKKPFILTKDNSPVSGKTYYETDDKIEFIQVNPVASGDRPAGNGWYEEDTRNPYTNEWYKATQEAVDLNNYQLTIGDYNLQDPGIQSEYGDVALIIGNGTDNANRSNAVTIGKDGLVGAYINYDTDTPGIDPETGQFFTRFAIINSNNNKVTYMDAHKWSGDRTLGVFGAQRKFEDSPDPIQNQFGLGIDGDKSLYVWIPDNAKEAWNKALNADHITSRGTSGIWTYRKWRSGDAECWGLIASKSYAMTNGPWGTGYYSQGNTVNFPSGLFTSTPTVSLNKCSSGNGLEWISIYGVTTSGVTYYACDTKSGTISFAIAAYARGRWK